jgi:hypothetical protein
MPELRMPFTDSKNPATLNGNVDAVSGRRPGRIDRPDRYITCCSGSKHEFALPVRPLLSLDIRLFLFPIFFGPPLG